jgi:hypothetical protein
MLRVVFWCEVIAYILIFTGFVVRIWASQTIADVILIVGLLLGVACGATTRLARSRSSS